MSNLLKTAKTVTLPGGQSFEIRKLLLADQEDMLGAFAFIVTILADLIGDEITDQVVKEQVPLAIEYMRRGTESAAAGEYVNRVFTATYGISMAEFASPDNDKLPELNPDEIMQIVEAGKAAGRAAGIATVCEFLNFFADIAPEQYAQFDAEDLAALWAHIYESNRLPFAVQRLDMVREGVIAKVRLQTQTSTPSYTEPESTPESQGSPTSTRTPSPSRISKRKNSKPLKPPI